LKRGIKMAAKTNKEILDQIKGNLIVSCQALESEPLFGSELMAKMAICAKVGGGKGIRANTTADICAIKKAVDLPVIGIIKRVYEGSECYITPTMKEVKELIDQAGPEIIAVDATNRVHPDGRDGKQFIAEIKKAYPNVLLMADISTYEEGIDAVNAGADLVSTTLSGYTPYTPKRNSPDFELMAGLSADVQVPVIGEGNIWSPDEAVRAFETGVFAIVVGTAITRPRDITKRFVESINSIKK
jgi:N-acylglucosamine-6-phosphate 2-epimerase